MCYEPQPNLGEVLDAYSYDSLSKRARIGRAFRAIRVEYPNLHECHCVSMNFDAYALRWHIS